MRKFLAILVVMSILLGAAAAWARGGSSADDCTPDSHDPDCTQTTRGQGK